MTLYSTEDHVEYLSQLSENIKNQMHLICELQQGLKKNKDEKLHHKFPEAIRQFQSFQDYLKRMHVPKIEMLKNRSLNESKVLENQFVKKSFSQISEKLEDSMMKFENTFEKLEEEDLDSEEKNNAILSRK